MPKKNNQIDNIKSEPTKVEIDENIVYPIDPKTETIHFPRSILIICGILIILMIACFVAIIVLGGN